MNFSFSPRLASIAVAALLSACASPTVVQSVKPGDNGLSCAQLQNEFADAERYRSDAEKEKTLTGGNVVRALLFWPAILGTAANANEAIAAADTRKVHLMNQMNQKNCVLSTGTAQGGTTVVEAASAAKPPAAK
jgi:phosphate starvation-inducible protein PhoH